MRIQKASAILFWIAILTSCGGSSIRVQGTEGGPCYPNGTCDDGLVCLSDLCVDPGGCTPAETEPCECPNGDFGVRTCEPSRDWGTCECSSDCGDGDCAGDETSVTCPQDCAPDTCGNGTIDAAEECDGTDLEGASCEGLGFASGTLACDTTCLLDTTDCSDTVYVDLEGIVWSPGADNPLTLPSNRFPVPGALVIAHSAQPALPPQGVYCNTCADEPPTDPYTTSDAQDGSFSLSLEVGASYWLTLRKGAFQRTTLFEVPSTTNGSFTLEEPTTTLPRPLETTLPNSADWTAGDHIPRIAVLDPSYEEVDSLLGTLGFDMATDVVLFEYTEIRPLIEDATALSQFNILLAFTSQDYPLGIASTTNLREWVRAGGTLFADDWANDFVEQPWPEFLTWYNEGVCGDGPTPPGSVGACNAGPSYSFTGVAPPTNFAAWINLPTVHNGAPLTFDEAWNYIYEIHPGVVGEDPAHTPILQSPTVWISNLDTTPAGTNLPAIVSWPFYCGRVIYSLPITAQSNPPPPYVLTLQEKVFYYLILGADGC